MKNNLKTQDQRSASDRSGTFPGRIILFCLQNKLVVGLISLFVIAWGVMVAPFDWEIQSLPRSPVPVDAIPDIGENQQVVFTEWPGRSPQDIEDQITYPITVSMLGIPGIKTVRGYSMFGFSIIYIIFKEDIDFYWSRSRVIEKFNSLSTGMLPDDVQPTLGPDATALGQVFWYTLEGRNKHGEPTGGWGLNELRSIQDWNVRYALLAADGISEVASVGGFVQEYQIDVSPNALRAYNVRLEDVFAAVMKSNVDVGARTIEVNSVEYVIRGLGFVKRPEDLEKTVVKQNNNVPVFIKDIAHVTLGPALRRGALDKAGVEAVGGVAVVRYGGNPLNAIKNLKSKIDEISPGLPAKILIDDTKASAEEITAFAERHGFKAYQKDGSLNHDAWLALFNENPDLQVPEWAELSKVEIVPFYDRTQLIYETLGTLNTALVEEILVTLIVILMLLMHLRSSIIISVTLPMAVLICFIAMKTFGVDANIVALSGIAIAIGTVVDMGIIICENIVSHLRQASPGANKLTIIHQASTEVAGAMLTAILTTIVSFLPVFTMTGAEGKLFKPLALTKTFALVASVIIALTIIPALAHLLFSAEIKREKVKRVMLVSLAVAGIVIGIIISVWIGIIMITFAAFQLFRQYVPDKIREVLLKGINVIAVIVVAVFLTKSWLPLGPGAGFLKNFVAVTLPISVLLLFFLFFRISYPVILRWCLRHKILFLSLPLALVLFGVSVWLGTEKLFGWLPTSVKSTRAYVALSHSFPGLGREFMPSLDEGSFLFMPTTMPHASIGEAMDILKIQDMSISAIPEVKTAVGKIGRAETALDPAPISMIETIINYEPEYLTDNSGTRLRFKYDEKQKDFFRDAAGTPVPAVDGKPYYVMGKYIRDSQGSLIQDDAGVPFRLWRPPLVPELNPERKAWSGIRNPDDIWNAILAAAKLPGVTSAPKLQPIAARLVMLQSGMRAPMGIKIKGPDLETIEEVGMAMERLLRDVPGVEPASVFADRIIGKPYLEIEINRDAIARFGLTIRDVQNIIEVAIGGKRLTTTVEGRERYPVRVRYLRELRDQIETIGKILVAAPNGQQIPLEQLADIRYTRGAQVIKSEDTFLIGYVLFDKKTGHAEVDVVEQARDHLESKITSGELLIPPGISYVFAGNYENQIRARKTLSVVLPLALFIIFMILYFQFKSVPVTALVFSTIAVAWSGGFILIWLYGQEWFLNFSMLGHNMRDIFQIHEINLSVAIWVGFLALFGIASDDGVVITTYLNQSFDNHKTSSIDKIREATVAGATRRIRPCLMTSATTILALLPVLTATGRGADIMIPMAIPSFGGMMVVLVSSFVVPTLYCLLKEIKFASSNSFDNNKAN